MPSAEAEAWFHQMALCRHLRDDANIQNDDLRPKWTGRLRCSAVDIMDGCEMKGRNKMKLARRKSGANPKI